jgi:opacity protein-like surface antigen
MKLIDVRMPLSAFLSFVCLSNVSAETAVRSAPLRSDGYYVGASGTWHRLVGRMNSYGIDGYGHGYNVGGSPDNLDLFVKSNVEGHSFRPEIRFGYDKYFDNLLVGGGINASIGKSTLSRCHGFSNARNYYYGGSDPSICASSWGLSTFRISSGSDASVFAKLGISFGRNDIYALGGVGLARLKTSVKIYCDDVVLGCGNNDDVASGSTSASKTRLGWSLGIGLQTRWSERISSNLEYRRMNWGTVGLRHVPASWSGISAAGHRTELFDDRLSLGFNYRL